MLVWHPRCGPCPSSELGGILNGSALLAGNATNGNITDTDCDRLSNSAMSEMQVCTRIHVFYLFNDVLFGFICYSTIIASFNIYLVLGC